MCNKKACRDEYREFKFPGLVDKISVSPFYPLYLRVFVSVVLVAIFLVMVL